MNTVPDNPDIHAGPMLVVRTRIIEASSDDLIGTIVGAFANDPDEPLRNEQTHPELVLEALPAENLAEAQDLAARLRLSHISAIAEQTERVKIVRLADATKAERDAVEHTPAGERDDLALVFLNLVPDLPVKLAAILAAKLHANGYQVTAPAAAKAGAL